MASEAQIAANRRNAGRSTGPKTAAGRSVAAQNALRHGLTARQVILHDESEEDFAAFHAELRAAFAPADGFEEELVERITLCAWRLRRVARIEADAINAMAESDFWKTKRISAAFEHRAGEMSTLAHYEAGLERGLYRAHMALERRQARRRGEDVPAPVAVQVEFGGEAPEKVNFGETNPIAPAPSRDETPNGAVPA
ncbi:MAG TPA: hypothetical protein VN832_06320 [Stellaceae bacterium]|nr:hypothetical protein [Stellaceae bacterium]